MSDPYYLRKANVDEIDLSKYEKDFSPEELAQVKDVLRSQQQQHQEAFDKLPFTERAKYHVGDVVDFVEQNPETFLGVPAGAALLGAGKVAVENVPKAAEKTKQVFGSLRDMMNSKKEEGLLAAQQAEKAAVENLAESTPKEVSIKATPKTGADLTVNVGKPLSSTDIGLVEKSEENTAKKLAEKKIAAAEKEMVEGAAKGLPETDLRTGTGKPAYAGKSETGKFKSVYPTPDAIPKGYAFVPGAQYIDPVRGNIGQETFTKEFSTRPYPETYKGTPTSAIEVSNEINRGLDRPTRSQLIAQGAKLPDNVKGITREVSKSKLVKVAGVGGALIALSDLALAGEKAKEGQYGEAAKIGVPAAAGLVSPAAGGLSEAVVNPSGAAQQLRGVAPVLGMFADIANKKVQESLNKPKGSVKPPSR